MVKVEKGGTYTANKVHSGTNDRGDWELVVVKAEGRARQRLTIFPTNMPTGIREGESFTIKEITGVAVKQKQDHNGEWKLFDTNVWAELERIEAEDIDALNDSLGDLDDLL